MKGLLPGRGPAGRAPGRGAPWPGRPPSRRSPPCWPAGAGRAGRGPGVAPEAGRGAPEPDGPAGVDGPDGALGCAGAGAENSAWGTGVTGAGLVGAAGATGATGAAGAAGAGLGPGRGPGAGAPEPAGREPAAGVTGEGPAAGLGPGAAGRAGAPGVGAPGLPGRGAPGLAAEGLPEAEPPPGPCSASVSLRTTGASIVEDAERTNSPSSWSLAMTTLLSTPNSLASSYTRTLATSLLLRSGVVVRRTVATSWAYSSRAHRVLIAISTYFQLAGYLTARCPVRPCLLTVLPARRADASRRYQALPGPGGPGGTPGGGPPGRDRRCWDAHRHPDRAAYRDHRGPVRPRPPPHAAGRSWPLAPGSRCRFAPGMLGCASGQTLLSLPPRADLTPSGYSTHGCSSVTFRKSGGGLLDVGTDVDPPAGEAGGQAGVLPLLADRQRQLVVRHRHPGGAGAEVDDLDLGHPGG